MISWSSNSTSLICLLHPWRRQPCASQPKPRRTGRRLRVGLPTPVKSEKMDRKKTCLGARFRTRTAVHREQPRIALNNRICRPVHRRSQPLSHRTNHRVDQYSRVLGTTRHQPQREFWSSTSLLGTTLLHLQGQTLTLKTSPKLNSLTLSSETMPNRDRAPPVIKMLSCQMRLWHTTSLVQDARLVEYAASGASVHSLPQGNASVQPAACVEYVSIKVKHVSNSGAIVKPIITTCMHIVSTEFSDMIMNCSHSKRMIRMQLIAVTRQRDTITRTAADTQVFQPYAQDPDQASTAASPDDERDLFRREEALRMDEERGTASKTCGARRTFNRPQVSSLLYNKLNMPFSEPSFTTTLTHWHRSQLGKRLCLAAGSSWDDLQSMRLRATVHTFWMSDWNSFGLRTGQSLQCRMPHAEQPRSKSSHVSRCIGTCW